MKTRSRGGVGRHQALVLVVAGLLGCTQERGGVLVVNVSGVEEATTRLRVTALLDGALASTRNEFAAGQLAERALRVGLRLPGGTAGRLDLHVEGLRADGCVSMRGYGAAQVVEGQDGEVAVPLVPLTSALCPCTAERLCWESPAPPDLPSNHLRGLWLGPDRSGWAVGDAGQIARFNPAGWHADATPTSRDLRGVWAAGPEEAWAVGAQGTLLRHDGTRWSEVATVPGLTATLHAVAGSGAGDLWAVGEAGVVLRRDGGVWADVTAQVPNPERATLRGISISGPGEGWAVGDGGLVLRLEGSRWSAAPTLEANPERLGLTGVYAAASGEAWAVGDKGLVLVRALDGGWTAAIPQPGPEQLPLTSVWGSGPKDVWVAGGRKDARSGVVLHYDGRWTSVPISEGQNALSALYGSGPADDVWAVGAFGTILRGRAASFQSIRGARTNQDFRAIWGNSSDNLWAVGGDPSSKKSLIWHHTGPGWQPVDNGGRDWLWGAFGLGKESVWAFGANGTLLRQDARSRAWLPEALPAPVAGYDIHAMWGPSPERLWAVVGKNYLKGAILHSRGSGWEVETRVSPALLPTEYLVALWGSGPEDIWAGGGDDDGSGILLHFDGTA